MHLLYYPLIFILALSPDVIGTDSGPTGIPNRGAGKMGPFYSVQTARWWW